MRAGIDLVWDAQGGGLLKLAVNEWPDGDHPASGAGTVPFGKNNWPTWIFYAVSYASWKRAVLLEHNRRG